MIIEDDPMTGGWEELDKVMRKVNGSKAEFGEYSDAEWTDWLWQQKNAIKDLTKLHYFTDKRILALLKEPPINMRSQITPYMLVHMDPSSPYEELLDNPWFRQFFPLNNNIEETSLTNKDNWESTADFPTNLVQHKYTNRCTLRFSRCLAYCTYCFEARRVLDKNSEKSSSISDWDASLAYIQKTPLLEEVILSGGEPMLLNDQQIGKILSDLREKTQIRFIRIHTRALTHNPFRITDEFVNHLKTYKVNEIAFHVAHPAELTQRFENAVHKIKEGAGANAPMLVTHTPLLAGVNDSTDTLWDLFSALYDLQIKPYYLIHTMPNIMFSGQHRLSVRDGLKLYLPLAKRHKSHIAIPEYVIAHYDGKQTVPLEVEGTPQFQYLNDASSPVVKFKNWQDKWVEYPDVKDRLT